MRLAKSLHFIGAAGIGMQGLIRLYLEKGFAITGSDKTLNQTVGQQLCALGMKAVDEQEDLERVNPDAVIYSSAITQNHPQFVWAASKNRLWHRSECLAHLFHQAKYKVAVTGTHGKTTVSSWLAYLLFHLKQAGCCVGGYVEPIGLCAWSGKDYFVIEADESDGSLKHYDCTQLVITNLEADHLDFWLTAERLYEFMYSYAQKASCLVVCADDPILKSWALPAVSYGFDNSAHLKILSYHCHAEGSTIELEWRGCSLGLFETKLWGKHNALNAAAVVATALALNCHVQSIKDHLSGFTGARRRLESIGLYREMRLYDDYAHHPTEVKSTIRALREVFGNKRLRVIFQPHRATRLKLCMDEFAQSFDEVDELWLCPLYLAGDSPQEGISHHALAQAIKMKNPLLKVQEFESLDQVVLQLGLQQPCDVCLTMGAGDITTVLRHL